MDLETSDEITIYPEGVDIEHIKALEQLSILYTDARHLAEEQSKLDPVTNPHMAFWASIQILHDVITKLNKIMIDAENKYILPKITPKVKAIIGGLWCEIGLIYMEVEEPAVEKQFKNCLEYLMDDQLNANHVISLIAALNNLGLIYSERDQQALSREYLEKAEAIFNDFNETSLVPVQVKSLFHWTPVTSTVETESRKILESHHTLTLYYLAQVYGKLDNHLKSAVYCHSTLKRQLESGSYDPIDWALNAATLSQYFTEKRRFVEARHHLCAASYVLDQYESELNNSEGVGGDEFLAKKETFNHRRADVSRCWCKYGILLLIFSKERLMIKSDEDDVPEDTDEVESTPEPVSQLWFSSLDLSHYETQVTDQFALMFDDARKIFLNAQDWVNKAKEYYSLTDHASDYAELIRDHSELYKALTFFEENGARQCCMHKRRIDLLESVLKELNPQFYTNVCRQLYYEAGETYSDILDLKLENLQASTDRPTPHVLKKINTLAEESINHFHQFLNTVKDASTKEMPVVIPEDIVRPVLLAYFHIGRLCHKIIVTDKKLQLINTQRSLDAYNFLVDYCAANEVAAKQMTLELGVVKEMVSLLPHKISKLLRETAS